MLHTVVSNILMVSFLLGGKLSEQTDLQFL